MVVKTNPVFKEMVFKCWKNEGENPGSSYQVFIAKAIEELYPAANPSASNIMDFWKQMRNLGLAESVKVDNKRRFTLRDPNNFEWDCSKEPLYRWLKLKPSVVQALPEVSILEAPSEITQEELEKARSRLVEFRKNIELLFASQAAEIEKFLQIWQGWEKNLQKAFEPYEEIIDNLNARVKCLQEIQILGKELRTILLDKGGEKDESKDESKEE